MCAHACPFAPNILPPSSPSTAKRPRRAAPLPGPRPRFAPLAWPLNTLSHAQSHARVGWLIAAPPPRRASAALAALAFARLPRCSSPPFRAANAADYKPVTAPLPSYFRDQLARLLRRAELWALPPPLPPVALLQAEEPGEASSPHPKSLLPLAPHAAHTLGPAALARPSGKFFFGVSPCVRTAAKTTLARLPPFPPRSRRCCPPLLLVCICLLVYLLPTSRPPPFGCTPPSSMPFPSPRAHPRARAALHARARRAWPPFPPASSHALAPLFAFVPPRLRGRRLRAPAFEPPTTLLNPPPRACSSRPSAPPLFLPPVKFTLLENLRG